VPLPSLRDKGLPVQDDLPIHRFNQLVFGGTGCEIKFCIEPVNLEEVPGVFPWGGQGPKYPIVPKTVGSPDCPDREGHLGVLKDFLRYESCQYYISGYPVNESPATRGIRIRTDEGKAFCVLHVYTPDFDLRLFVRSSACVCAREAFNGNPYT